MTYLEVQPDHHLAPFVKCFWTSASGEAERSHTILPDGCFDLIADVEAGKIIGLKLTGIWSIPIHVHSRAQQRRLAVRFRPLAAELLADIALPPLLNTAIALPSTFWGIDRLADDDFEAFCSHLQQQLGALRDRVGPLDTRKVRLFEQVGEAEAGTVQEIASAIGWSPRSINRYFQARLGLSLKRYLNILRVHAAYQAIAQAHPLPDGFYDQAHFIREIKRFTGVSPKALRRNQDGRFIQFSTRQKD